MELKDILMPKFEVHIVCNEKENYTKAVGSTPSLLTALSCFVTALRENKIDEDAIRFAVEQGLKDQEEIEKALNDKLDKLMKKIFE